MFLFFYSIVSRSQSLKIYNSRCENFPIEYLSDYKTSLKPNVYKHSTVEEVRKYIEIIQFKHMYYV